MVGIEPFEVEQWMDRYEQTPGVLNIAETCAASVSIDELVGMCKDETAPGPLTLSTKLTYGAIRGSEQLRQRVASQLGRDAVEPLSPESIVITQGAIAANFLVFYSLVGPGDHVVCVHPTYAQLYAVPRSLGAEVSLWELKPEHGYIPNVSELERLIRANTKLIVVNNPNNPTGSTIPAPVLKAIVALARTRGITVLADEVYSPLYHTLPDGQTPPSSVLSFGYDKTIATGSMSKAYALAGIRLGWIGSRDAAIIDLVLKARDYTTISVSQLDDQVACYALSDAVFPSLMQRNIALARSNLARLSAFVDKYSSTCSWVKPTAGTTALVQFRKRGQPVDDPAFVLEVLGKTKVLFLPAGPCFGEGKKFRGFVRIGYVCHSEVLTEALKRLGQFVEENLL
ncbi:PLP-dependent transferase [Thozetella sp. PMI_491]|nr:PLP-dependent transferase [Thozetella sp. PMI_491]